MLRLDEKTSHFLYTILLALLGYFCIGWLSLYLFNFKKFHVLDLYFLPSFTLMFSGLFYFIRKENAFCFLPTLEKREWQAITLVAFSFCITRFLKIDEMRIWLDEYTQFLYGVQSSGDSLLEFSFYEQQPPLGYMLSGFAKMFFGFSPFALKFHVLFFSLLFFLVLPFCFRFFTKKILPRYAVVLFLLFSRPLLVYSMEARPLMLSTFFSLLSMTFLLMNFASKRRLSFIAALISSMIYTTTTGLQPQIFLLVFCIGLSLVGIDRRWISLKIGFLTFLYNVPVICFLIEFTKRTNQFNSTLFDKLTLLFSFEGMREVSSILLWDPYLLAVPSLLIGLFSLLSFFRETNSQKKKVMLLLIIFPFVYIALYSLTYYSFISWRFTTRYLLNFFSAFSFFLLIGMSYIFNLKRASLKRIVVTLLIALFLFGSFRVIKHPFIWYVASAQRLKWQDLYQDLNKKVLDGDRILKFTLTNIGNWRGSLFVGEGFYSNQLVQQNTLKNSSLPGDIALTVFCDIDADYLKQSTGKLYLIHDPSRLSAPVNSIAAPEMGFKLENTFEVMELYSVNIETNIYITIKRYFDILIKRYENFEATTPLLETMFCLEEKYGTLQGFNDYLDMYKSIKIKQTWSKSGQYYNKKQELEKRIQYFTNMMDEKWK